MNELAAVEPGLIGLLNDLYEIEAIEDELSRFNIFDALRVMRAEIRHSNFLGFLLDPKASHGLGVLPLRRFLFLVVRDAGEVAFTPGDLMTWDLTATEVFRERDNIDLLLVNSLEKVVIVIENKIDAGESDTQLARYKAKVEADYPGFRKLFIFLTPDGSDASDSAFQAVGYNHVVQMLEELLDRRRDRMPSDVAVAIRHYVNLIRRHILKDTELAAQARSLYLKHKLAFDFIFENMPDEIAGLHDRFRAMVSARPGLNLLPTQRSFTRFVPAAWDIDELNRGTGWSGSNALVCIELSTQGDCIRLLVVVGPGPDELRQKLHAHLASQSTYLFGGKSQLAPQWHRIFSETWIKKGDFDLSDPDRIFEQTQAKWQLFVQNQLPEIEKLVASCFVQMSNA